MSDVSITDLIAEALRLETEIDGKKRGMTDLEDRASILLCRLRKALESVTAPTEAKGGAQLISAERTRQIDDEGYSALDDAGKAHALVDAAVAYAHAGSTSKGKVPLSWPWADRFWKPSDDPVRNLTKAGALIAAAIDSYRSAGVSS